MDRAEVNRLLDGEDVRRRAIRITGELHQEAVEQVMVKLFYLMDNDGFEPLTLEIDSPGGRVWGLVGIFNMMDLRRRPDGPLEGVPTDGLFRRSPEGRLVQAPPTPIGTLCLGRAHGTAAVLLAHGDRGLRAAVRTASIEFSPLWTLTEERSAETDAQIEECVAFMAETLVHDTGLSMTLVRGLFSEHSVFNAETARVMKLIDRIVD